MKHYILGSKTIGAKEGQDINRSIINRVMGNGEQLLEIGWRKWPGL